MHRRRLLKHGVGGLGLWWAAVPGGRVMVPSLPANPPPEGGGALGAVSVRAHGAVGDGRTDDGDALQAAIDVAAAAGGGGVVVERGDYAHACTLQVPARVHLFGLSGYRYDFTTRLNYTGKGTALRITGDHVSLSGLSIFTASGRTGLHTNRGIALTVRDVNIQGFSAQAVLCDRSFWVRLHRVHIQGGLRGGDGIVATESFNQNVIDSCGFTCAGDQHWTAVDIGTVGKLTSTGSSIVNSDFSGGWGDGPLIRLRAGTHGLYVAGNRVESSGAGFLRQDRDALGITVIGNYIAGSTALPAASGLWIEGDDCIVTGNTFCDVQAVARVGPRAERVLIEHNACLASVSAEARLIGTGQQRRQRSLLAGFVQMGTVAASQGGVPMVDAAGARIGRPMPRAGSVTGLAVTLRRPPSGGELSVMVERSREGRDGFSALEEARVVVTPRHRGAQAVFPSGIHRFAAGDLLRPVVATTRDWSPSANDLDVVLEIET